MDFETVSNEYHELFGNFFLTRPRCRCIIIVERVSPRKDFSQFETQVILEHQPDNT